jgi:NADPH-dependent glutamate synthase beta subunit-like oxidoreductase/CO/xanthine dehydrogenase FAD-binding subunit
MKTLTHYSPSTVSEANDVKKEMGRRARFVAGGTDLLGTLKDAVHPSPPNVLVDLKRIPGLDDIEVDADGLRIGAMVRLTRLETDPAVTEDYGLLARAARSVASPQLRNMGTLGGNLCQEPRCWYYRYPDNGFACLRKGGGYCPALTGENRFHSIFGAVRVGEPSCTKSCPASTDIPGYLAMLRGNDWDNAARRILQANPMPALTGRICPHFCQDDCRRNDADQSVSIRAVERRLGDYILDRSDRFMIPGSADTGRSIAVVGAGPAGLSCAFYLRRAGFQVTIYDRLDEPGGMLFHAIPAYRLPRDQVHQFVSALKNMNVDFKLGVELGRDIFLENLQHDHDAVFIGTGAWKSPTLGIEGEDSARSGLDFLTEVARGRTKLLDGSVAVIGGGNVAVDVGVTAKRLGAREVTMICLEKQDEMPAHEWEIHQALEEGVRLLPEWGPSRIAKTDQGLRVELVRCTTVFDDQGAFCPAYDPDDIRVVDVDTVFTAVGQRVDSAGLNVKLTNRRGHIAVDAFTQETGESGLYAGGDAVTGPATVIGAVASGRRAAEAIAKRFDQEWPVREHAPIGTPLLFDHRSLDQHQAAREALLSLDRRRVDREDTETLNKEAALSEAGRCLNCGCVAVSPADLPPALVALDASIRTDRRTLPAEIFFRAVPFGSTVLADDEMVTHILVPKPKTGMVWSFEKFRRRGSIDFPIAGVAICLEMENGRVKGARIVLGAAASTPIRATEAESVLIGGPINEETATESARAAVAQARPLAENEYKIIIFEALVRRNILALADV